MRYISKKRKEKGKKKYIIYVKGYPMINKSIQGRQSYFNKLGAQLLNS